MYKQRFILLGPLVLAGSWYATLAVHELGHALVALATGSTDVDVHLPLMGFSSTYRFPNDHPLLTTAAAPLLGSLLHFLAWKLTQSIHVPGYRVLQFWSGFAFVLNGSYIAGDAFLLGGDSAEMIRAGMSPWMLYMSGLLGVSSGLWMWHTLGAGVPSTPEPEAREPRFGVITVATVLLVASLLAVAVF